ncbi:MAG: peptidyl-tRNA hydrolase [Candidatus Peregrinibacteria bacterium Gr01-1014_25]|nr:MAG: peptidyl-tRNA hydrolase [Candidatus Peregrinibacteria bacterium Gr01-1014_25]
MKPSLVIIGLGNPGDAYRRTRHNVGFFAVDTLADAFGTGEWKPADKFRAMRCEGRIVTVPILLVRPQTFMNDSGDCIRRLRDFYKLDPAAFVVLCDDIDLPLGTVRMRKTGGPGTHNGLKSVVDVLGEGFPRIRIGIGPKPDGADLAAWVLSVCTKEESAALDDAVKTLPVLVRELVVNDKA